jgi:hypothetical protein
MWVALALNLALAAPAAADADDELVMVAPEQLAQYWVVDRSHIEHGIAQSEVPRNSIGCAAVSFIIERNGHTSTFKLLRAEPEGYWAEVARKVVANLSFSMGPKNTKRDAAFTYLTLSFNGTGNETLGTHLHPRISVDDRMNEMCAVKGVQLGQ